MPHDQPPFDPSADPEVNAARRRFGALFALFGGGAVAASCGAEEGPIADLPSTRRVAQALSIDSAAIGRLDTVDELLGAPGTAGNTNSVGMSTFKLVLVNNYHSDAPGGAGSSTGSARRGQRPSRAGSTTGSISSRTRGRAAPEPRPGTGGESTKAPSTSRTSVRGGRGAGTTLRRSRTRSPRPATSPT